MGMDKLQSDIEAVDPCGEEPNFYFDVKEWTFFEKDEEDYYVVCEKHKSSDGYSEHHFKNWSDLMEHISKSSHDYGYILQMYLNHLSECRA